MTNVNKTVAERLRECVKEDICAGFPKTIGKDCSDFETCTDCHKAIATNLADMIEAEQAELRNQSVDIAALDLLCDKLECGDANHRATAAQIRKAMNGAKPQLPDGIEWPRFEDGELVKMDHNFMNAIWDKNGPDSWVVTSIEFKSSGRAIIRAKDVFGEDCDKIELNRGERVKRPEPEVLDADGVPIKVGDTVYAPGYFEAALKVERFDAAVKMVVVFSEETLSCGFRGDQLTHRKPDTHGDIEDDATMPPWTYCSKVLNIEEAQTAEEMVTAMCKHLIQRTREVYERSGKLMGGE